MPWPTHQPPRALRWGRPTGPRRTGAAEPDDQLSRATGYAGEVELVGLAGLVQALLARARADERAVLDQARRDADARSAAAAPWAWLAAPEHRALLTLWLEGHARSLVEPHGPGAAFATRIVHDWLALLADVVPGDDDVDRTLLLAVLRGCHRAAPTANGKRREPVGALP